MKKVFVLFILALFLTSCGPGAAVSRAREDIAVTLSPAASGYKVDLYSSGTFVGEAYTDARGIATFKNLPIGSYQASIYDPNGVKVSDKYFSSKSVSGPKAYSVSVKLTAVVPPAPSVPAPVKVCTPGQSWCENNIARTCRSDGMSIDGTPCVAPTPVCTTITATATTLLPKAVCVQCTVDGNCPSGQTCQGNACVTPTQICTPNKLWCEGNVLKSCKYDGTAIKQTACTSPTPFCEPSLTKCVQCRSDSDCGGGQICKSNVCEAVVPACQVPTTVLSVASKCFDNVQCGQCAITSATFADYIKYQPIAGKIINPDVTYTIALPTPVPISKLYSLVGKMEWCGWFQMFAVDTNNNEYRMFYPHESVAYTNVDLTRYSPSVWVDKVLDPTTQIKEFKILLSHYVGAVAGRYNVYQKHFGARLAKFEVSATCMTTLPVAQLPGYQPPATAIVTSCGDGVVSRPYEDCESGTQGVMLPNAMCLDTQCGMVGTVNQCKCPVTAGVPPPAAPIAINIPIPVPPPIGFCGDGITTPPKEMCESDAGCPYPLSCIPPGFPGECTCVYEEPGPPLADYNDLTGRAIMTGEKSGNWQVAVLLIAGFGILAITLLNLWRKD